MIGGRLTVIGNLPITETTYPKAKLRERRMIGPIGDFRTSNRKAAKKGSLFGAHEDRRLTAIHMAASKIDLLPK